MKWIAFCAFVAALATGAGHHLAAQAPLPAPTTFVVNELIVRLRDGDSAPKLAALLSRLGATGATALPTVDGLYLIHLPDTVTVPSAALFAKQLAEVAYAEPNYVVSTGLRLPDDPSFGELWGLNNTGQSGGTPDADIDAPEAWDYATGSSDVVVAVIDTGIDYTHPDLAANMFRNEADCDGDAMDDDGNGYVDDCYGIDTANHDSNPMDDNNHGTHVAGTIGAAGNNGVGVVGVNWRVKLMPCKFLDSTGSGSTSDAITCLEYVAAMKDRGVNIVATNNSWGGGGSSQALADAIDAQRQRGILFIAAAGNDGTNNDTTPHYPAAIDLPNVISVASTTRTDSRSSFSNYGRHSVHIGAPGSSVFSTTPGNAYATMSGTSMAAPHVTGLAALLKAQSASRDWRALRSLILSGGDATGGMDGVTVTGRRLNALGSLTCSGATAFSRVTPRADSVTTTAGAAVTIAALNIACAAGAGNVTVAIDNGGTLILLDDGVSPDQAAGDGVYTGSFVPASVGLRTLTFPDATTVTVEVLSGTAYLVQPVTYAFRDMVGANLSLTDDSSATVASPFAVAFGDGSFNTLHISSNGLVSFSGANTAYANISLPTAAGGSVIAPFWDDLIPGGGAASNVFWSARGNQPYRELVIEWRDMARYSCDSSLGVTVQAVFFESSPDILFNYADTVFGGSCIFADEGASATIGVQTSQGVARQYSVNTAAVTSGSSLLWTLPGTSGAFTDSLLAGSTTVKALHITELRTRINALRARFGLAPRAWTDPDLVAGVATAKVVHVVELRTGLDEAYDAAGVARVAFTDQVIQSGQTVIRAIHIAELRDAVIALESR